MHPIRVKNLLFFLCCFAFYACPVAERQLTENQPAEKRLMPDKVYEENIKSIQLYRGGNELNYPVLYLNDQERLSLEFDEWLSPGERQSDFYVDIVNCDAFWNPTNLIPIQFYDGFTQDFIGGFNRSAFTKVPYVHYSYSFPQENEGFKQSGNYLLKVFRDGDPNQLVFTKRFVVVNPKILVQPTNLLDDVVLRQRFEEFRFEVVHRGMRLIDPTRELQTFVLQNFRWDNALQMDQPFRYGNEQLEYRILLGKDFAGGNEFRWHDVRSTRFYSPSVREVFEDESKFTVHLFGDQPREDNVFAQQSDLNGGFMIDVQEWDQADISADYVLNQFRLNINPVPDGKVFLLGGLTNWQILPEFQMDYNPDNERYEANIWLKQGFYDYQYVIKRPGIDEIDERSIEGINGFGENFYTILVYHKAPTSFTHEVVGYFPFNYAD